jgi:type I restriction enzyme R subunit
VVFEVELLKSQEINLDYILELIFEKARETHDKGDLIEDARRVIRASLGSRAKESLLIDFINKMDLDLFRDKASVIDAFFAFAQGERTREVEALIQSENLNSEAAKRYISASIKREFASENGADLNSILPRMSPLHPQFRARKATVFDKISSFVEKFKGVGGQL